MNPVLAPPRRERGRSGAKKTSSASPRRIPTRRVAPDAVAQLVEVERGASAEILVVSSKECLTGAAPLVAQHAQEFPLGVELRRIAEFDHHLAGDAMDAHVRPFGALGVIRLRDLAQ